MVVITLTPIAFHGGWNPTDSEKKWDKLPITYHWSVRNPHPVAHLPITKHSADQLVSRISESSTVSLHPFGVSHGGTLAPSVAANSVFWGILLQRNHKIRQYTIYKPPETNMEPKVMEVDRRFEFPFASGVIFRFQPYTPTQ